MDLLRKWKNEETKSAYIMIFRTRYGYGLDSYLWDIAETVATGRASGYSEVDVIKALKICMESVCNRRNSHQIPIFRSSLSESFWEEPEPYWTQERLDAVDWEHLADIMITDASRRLMRQ